MVKSLALAAAIVPSAMAINTNGSLYSSFVSLSIELIGFPDWAGQSTVFTLRIATRLNKQIQDQGQMPMNTLTTSSMALSTLREVPWLFA